MISVIKKIYSKVTTDFIKKGIRNYRLKLEIKKINRKHKELITELRKTPQINVIFLVIHDSVWKYEGVYKLLAKDARFQVTVVIIPLVRAGKPDMQTYHQTLHFFQKNNYHVFSSYDSVKHKWLNVKTELKPDIVFFTNPHHLTFDKYYIDEFKEKLTAYVPYAFVVIHSIEMHYNQKIHHLLWKHFVETSYHKDFAKKFSKLKNSNNIFLTGYPGVDSIFKFDYRPQEVWKKTNNKTVKIVWAPHHTIKGQGSGLDYSSFFEYSDFFIDLIKDRSDIQVAFKPHPLLKEKLYKDNNWGKEKTDNYYKLWSKMPNGQLETGPYIDLFYTSDAMIMDSASFIAEYLYFNKPLCFTMVDQKVKGRFNSFGQMIFDYLYKARDKEEIEHFINDIVINKNDFLEQKRNRFFREVILPEKGKTASENIYNEIVKEVC